MDADKNSIRYKIRKYDHATGSLGEKAQKQEDGVTDRRI